LVTDETGGAVNLAREVELLCVSGLLIGAQWWLLSSAEPLVGSDLGFAGARFSSDNETTEGYVFPLSSRIAVYVGNGVSNFDVEQPSLSFKSRETPQI
jgi:hypothetical protein